MRTRADYLFPFWVNQSTCVTFFMSVTLTNAAVGSIAMAILVRGPITYSVPCLSHDCDRQMTINQFSHEPVVVFGWSCTTV
jgi:hypothetical protein